MPNLKFKEILVAAFSFGLMATVESVNAAVATGELLVGEIQAIKVLDPSNPWSRGTITVSGIDVIIPANLIIQMPVQRYTVQELFTNAPAACKALKQTGLARSDTCFQGRRGAVATINANRQPQNGQVIAGLVKIEKAPEFMTGVITYINYDDGYFRLNGRPKDPDTGVMVRINDPTARHTIQKGLACNKTQGAGNCSPDERFSVDNENYTAAFVTGVPLCIPSTQTGGKRTVGSDSEGFGDAFCPKWARQPDPIVDTIPESFAYNFVPILLGESLDAMGSFETVKGDDGREVKFFSAHTIRAHSRIMTSPGSPDYMTYGLAEWDVAGYTNQRARLRIIGYTSLTDSQLDIYALHVDPSTNTATEFPLATTVGNPRTINAGLVPFGGSIFKIMFDVDFIGGVKANNSPCSNLAQGGFLGGDVMTGGCPSGPTSDIGQNFAILAPISRDIIGRTRNKFINKIGPSKDILGGDAPNGQYLSPVSVAFPNPLETNVHAVQASFLFSGLPWNLDRRLSPQGCGKVAGDCSGPANTMLSPWPFDGGVDPRKDPLNPVKSGVPADTADRIISYVSGTPGIFQPGNIMTRQLGATKAAPVLPGVAVTTSIPAVRCSVK